MHFKISESKTEDTTGEDNSEVREPMRDPIHNGLDAVFRRIGGNKNALKNYWSELRGKPPSSSSHPARGVVGHHSAGHNLKEPMALPIRGGHISSAEKKQESPPRVSDRSLGEGLKGMSEERDRNFAGRTVPGSTPPRSEKKERDQAIIRDTGKEPAARTESRNLQLPSSEPKERKQGRTKDGTRNFTARADPKTTSPQSSEPKQIERAQTKVEIIRTHFDNKSSWQARSENLHIKQSDTRPQPQEPQSAPLGIQHKHHEDDAVSMAPTGRGLGEMGRTIIQGMVSRADLHEPEAARIQEPQDSRAVMKLKQTREDALSGTPTDFRFGDMNRTVIEGMVSRPATNESESAKTRGVGDMSRTILHGFASRPDHESRAMMTRNPRR